MIAMGDVLRGLLRPWRAPPREVVRRLDEVLIGSLPLVVVTVAGVGAAMGDQAARQALRLLGDQSFIGPEYITLGVQEFGPLVVAITLSMRVGAGFAAELATRVAEQTVDAHVLFGTDPVRRLVVPMAIALPLGATALSILGAAAWEAAGLVTMLVRSGTNPFTFFHPDAVRASMWAELVGKSAGFGTLIHLGATSAALDVGAHGGGSDGVGRATTNAVVLSVLLCLLLNLVVDIAWYLAGATR